MPPPLNIHDSIPPSTFPLSRLTHRRSFQDNLGRTTSSSGSFWQGSTGGPVWRDFPKSQQEQTQSLPQPQNDKEAPKSVAEAYASVVDVYDLIYPDWKGTMKRQARSLHALIINLLTDNPTCATVPSSILAPSVTSPTPSLSFSSLSILDASCGIGTQTIGLASLGCRMSGSDVCEAAVNRCRKEGQKKGLNIELIVSDMRDVRPGMFKNARRKTEVVEEIEGEAKEIGFDVVMSLGDSLPHLLTRRDMVLALTSLFDCLRPGGLALFSFTDRAAAPKGDEKGGHSTNMRACGIRPSSKTTGDGQPGNRYIVWQVWDWVRPQRKSRPMTASSTSSGNVGGWHFMKSDSVVGLLGGGHSHHIDGDVPADGSLSKRDEYDDTETDGSKNAGGGDDDDMDEDLADDWLPQDDDPMGLRPPEVRDEVWLAPNGLSPLAERGSLRMRSRQPSITSPLSASQGALATISGLARPMMETEHTTVSIPMVDLQVSLYDLSLYFLEDDGVSSSANAKIMRIRCRAWSCTEVLGLMQEVGFVHVGRAPDNTFSQPLLYGYKPM